MTYPKVIKIWVGLILLFGIYLSLYFYYQRKNYLSFNFKPRPILSAKNEPFPKDITAKAYLVMDARTGTIVKSKNKNWRLPPASLTKIPVAILALKKYPLSHVLEVKKEYPVGKIMNLKKGEKIDINGLMHGLLIHSANDAAYVLAGENDKKRREFINQMNQLAQDYDLNQTHFVNFDGEEDIGHLSSAFDLGHLTRISLKNPIFKRLIKITEKVIYDQSGEIVHRLENTNELLGDLDNVKGVKTGWTPQAGECLISLVYIDNNPVLTVVLGSEDRFGESIKIIDWANENLIWQQPY